MHWSRNTVTSTAELFLITDTVPSSWTEKKEVEFFAITVTVAEEPLFDAVYCSGTCRQTWPIVLFRKKKKKKKEKKKLTNTKKKNKKKN